MPRIKLAKKAGIRANQGSTMDGRQPASGEDLLDLLPHPAFVVEVEGNDLFRFSYVNDAYRALLGSDVGTGDLRSVVPANALVAHVRAFARAAGEARTIAFEADWGAGAPPRTVAGDVRPTGAG